MPGVTYYGDRCVCWFVLKFRSTHLYYIDQKRLDIQIVAWDALPKKVAIQNGRLPRQRNEGKLAVLGALHEITFDIPTPSL